MITVSITIGGGSTFLIRAFKHHGWNVYQRPDKLLGGMGIYCSDSRAINTFLERTRMPQPIIRKETYTSRELYKMFEKENKNKKNTVAVVMAWGGLGFLSGQKPKPIYIIRNPVCAFNSEQGGGWKYRRRKEYEKYQGDPHKLIDFWLDKKSLWNKHTLAAISAIKNNTGHIVRYNNFARDWVRIKINNLPPIQCLFACTDQQYSPVATFGEDAINYLDKRTCELWEEFNCTYEASI